MNTAIQLVQKSLDSYSENFQNRYWETTGKKMGFPGLEDKEIFPGKELLNWMENNLEDYTNIFLVLEEKDIPQSGIYSHKSFQDIKKCMT